MPTGQTAPQVEDRTMTLPASHLDSRSITELIEDARTRARRCEDCRPVLADLLTHIDALHATYRAIYAGGDQRSPANRQGATS